MLKSILSHIFNLQKIRGFLDKFLRVKKEF